MAANQPFPPGTFKVEPGPGKNEVSVLFRPTQSTIVFPLPAPVRSLRIIASITQGLAASVALVKRKSRKPQESWNCRLLKEPCRRATHERMVARAGEAARSSFLIHSRMLRHSCGYKTVEKTCHGWAETSRSRASPAKARLSRSGCRKLWTLQRLLRLIRERQR
jgi:hypothetical protein